MEIFSVPAPAVQRVTHSPSDTPDELPSLRASISPCPPVFIFLTPAGPVSTICTSGKFFPYQLTCFLLQVVLEQLSAADREEQKRNLETHRWRVERQYSDSNKNQNELKTEASVCQEAIRKMDESYLRICRKKKKKKISGKNKVPWHMSKFSSMIDDLWQQQLNFKIQDIIYVTVSAAWCHEEYSHDLHLTFWFISEREHINILFVQFIYYFNLCFFL